MKNGCLQVVLQCHRMQLNQLVSGLYFENSGLFCVGQRLESYLILQMEFVPVVLAASICLWEKLWSHQCSLFICDNSTSTVYHLLKLLRNMSIFAIKLNFLMPP